MAKTRNNALDVTNDPMGAVDQFGRMLREGRSFSGRERHCCFLNTRAERFANISAATGLDFPDDGRGTGLVDWDHDGDLDIWLSNRNAPRLRFMRNDMPRGNHFLALQLVGNGTTTNRDAIGARVEVVLKDENPAFGSQISDSSSTRHSSPATRHFSLIKTLRAGEGFLSQSTKCLNFGLGKTSRVKAVVVRWPGGEVEEFTGFEVDRRYRLVQGQSHPNALATRTRSLALSASQQQLASSSGAARIPLVTLLPMFELTYKRGDGADVDIPLAQGKAVLLNLWASSCAPCVAEVKRFTARADEFRAAGIEPIAVCVDEFFGGGSDPVEGDQFLVRLGYPFSHGLASKKFLDTLQIYYDHVMFLTRSLPIPLSFLIDQQGHLAVIYRGAASVDDIINDARHSAGTMPERRQRSALLPGTVIEHDRVLRTEEQHDLDLQLELAGVFQNRQQYNLAADHYRRLLKLHPDSAVAHLHLGIMLEQQGQLEEAAAEYQNALRSNSVYADAEFRLGTLLVRQQQWSQAAARFQRAIELRSDDAKAHHNLGYALMRQGKLDKAIGHYKKSLEFQPDLHVAYTNLGKVLLLTGGYEEATAHLKKALAIESSNAEAHLTLVEVLLKRGKASEALQEYRQVLPKIQDNPRALNTLGMALGQHGKLGRAVHCFTAALKAKSDFSEAHGNLANVLVQQGKLDEAIREYQKTLRGRPDDPVIYNLLGSAHAQQGNLDQAITHIHQALQLDPGFAHAHEKLGLIFLRQQKFTQAIASFRQAHQLKPDWLGPLNNLAWFLAVHRGTEYHDPPAAVRFAERACELTDYNSTPLLDTLAVARAADGNFSEAVAAAEKALKLTRYPQQKELAKSIQKRLELFKANQPYVEEVAGSG